MAVLTHLADLGWLGVFAGQENYLIVVLVGLGLVSSLLFIARENETRFQTPTLEDAAAESLRLAGPTLAGGMMLAILGLGMLIFAQFGKFQELGGAFLIGAGFVLLAATTLAPPLVVLMGRWAFWPNMRTERISAESAWCLPRGAWSLVTERGWSGQIWQSLGRSLAERPRTVGLTCLFAMLPFVVVAGLCHSRLTYGMLSQLPEDKPSVKGAEIIQQQFPAGTTGPVTLLLEHPKWQFGTADGKTMVAKLSDRLEDRKGEFDIADIRSVAYPLGLTEKDVGSKTFLQRTLRHRKAVEYYVGDKAPAADHATKLEIVFAQDPFARESIDNFERLRSKLPELLPSELAGAKWHLMGAPASIRDLKTVTDRDRALVYGLVLAGVFAGLLFLVRRVAVAAGLTITGGLCFLTALGATYAATWAWNPAEFDGLDWKVPTLLFVILMAFGVQGAWVLLARLDEEQQQHGHREGLLRALECTGSLCLGGGFLVAGVFASMMSGSLVGLEQLGFALASGILLDALIIRPLLIPAGLLVVSQNFTQSELPSPLKSLPPKAPPPENLAATVPPKTGT